MTTVRLTLSLSAADIPPRDPLPGREALAAVALASAAVAGVLWALRRRRAPAAAKRLFVVVIVGAAVAALLVALFVAVPVPRYFGGGVRPWPPEPVPLPPVPLVPSAPVRSAP